MSIGKGLSILAVETDNTVNALHFDTQQYNSLKLPLIRKDWSEPVFQTEIALEIDQSKVQDSTSLDDYKIW